MSQSCVVRVRRHAITQAVTGLEVDDERAAQVAGRELEPCSRGAWCGPVWWRGPGAAALARGKGHNYHNSHCLSYMYRKGKRRLLRLSEAEKIFGGGAPRFSTHLASGGGP
jgi:hypothetical protein